MTARTTETRYGSGIGRLVQQPPAFVVRALEQVAVAEPEQVEGEEPDGEVVERLRHGRGALVPDVAAAAFLHELEVDPAVFAVDDDLAVEVGGLAVEGGARTPARSANSAVKSMLLRLVSTVVPSGAIRMAAR